MCIRDRDNAYDVAKYHFTKAAANAFAARFYSVSYTHLDVYKRQAYKKLRKMLKEHVYLLLFF